jgi:pimeloyl-ACP methyl ester carboxylesterase
MISSLVSTGKLLARIAVVQTVLLLTFAANFPLPSGPFNTTLTISQLTDHTCLDHYSPTPGPRSLMVSIFQPSTCIAIPTPYMDPITAAWTDTQLAEYGIPAGTFESLYLQTCPHSSHHTSPKLRSEIRNRRRRNEKFPLLIFSPGLGDPRLYYSALAQEIASKGYTVITIDHPYDAGVVVFPDNSTVFGANITTDDQIVFDLSVRVKVVSFVLDQLSQPTIAHSIAPCLKCVFDATKAGIFGHSLGGATAAQAVLEDHRLVAGVNLDGSFFGSVIETGLSDPFLLFAHEGKNISSDASWAGIWPELTGFKRIWNWKAAHMGLSLIFWKSLMYLV